MDRRAFYPVCPYRNVPAAFARFSAPDAGGVERFFIDKHARFVDALHALALSIWLTGCLCGARLARKWSQQFTHPQRPLLLGPPPIAALRAWAIARASVKRSARYALALRQRWGAPAAHAFTYWAAHPQLSLFVAPQPVLPSVL